MPDFTRSFPLEDVTIRSGDGRTVEAYAAVFNTDTSIADQDGRYRERIAPIAFNKTLADNGTRFGVLFNHGLTIYGTPSDRGSMPIGTCEEIRADGRGLLTVTRYNKTPLAEEALEGWKTGSITAQSFQGRFVTSDKRIPRGGFRPDATTGELTTVTRTEIALKEYGPAVFAAYPTADLVGVRSTSPELLDAVVDALCETQASLDAARSALADSDDADLIALASRLETATARTASTSTDAAAGTPVTDHVARFLSLRAKARKIGVLP